MLDSKDALRGCDKANMLAAIESMPRHLSEGLRLGRLAGLPRFQPDRVLVCGVGGSAIGGDLLKEWLVTSCDTPCEVCRSYSAPTYANKNTLAIVVSYSGNTEETLGMLDDVRRKRAQVVAICSGGELARIAQSKSIPFARIPSGLVPRASLGYLFGAMMGIVERSGIASHERQFEETFRMLSDVSRFCSPDNATGDNPAKKLAHELLTSVPLVFGYGLSAPVAKRWSNQLNENAKSIAFSAELPELDHNLIVGLAQDARARNFAAVFLDHAPVHESMRTRVAATKSMLSEYLHVYSVESQGLSPLAKLMSLATMGDYVSFYLAVLRNQDPSSTAPIDRLKVELSKK